MSLRTTQVKSAMAMSLACLALGAAACGGASGSAGSAQPNSSGGASKPPATLTTVTVGMISPQAAAGFLDMAQQQGYYKDCGVDLKVIQVASGAQLSPALVSGSVDMAIEGPAQMLIALQKGIFKAKIIGSVMDGLPWAIYGSKSVTSLSQLAGKTMAVSSGTGLNEVVAKLILTKNGINPKTVKFVNAGSNANKFKALVAGVVDSASIPSDYIPEAKKDGLNILATAAQQIPLYPRWAILARDSFLSAHPKAATCYLAAMARGERYAFAHPKQADALTAKVLKTSPTSPVVTDMYNQIVQEKLINKNVQLPLAKLAYQQQNLVQIGLLKKPLPVSQVFDDQYRLAALKMIGGAQ